MSEPTPSRDVPRFTVTPREGGVTVVEPEAAETKTEEPKPAKAEKKMKGESSDA